MRRHDGVKAHRILSSGLYMAGSTRRRPVEVAHLDGDRLCALEVHGGLPAATPELESSAGFTAITGLPGRQSIEGRAGAIGRTYAALAATTCLRLTNLPPEMPSLVLPYLASAWHRSGT